MSRESSIKLLVPDTSRHESAGPRSGVAIQAGADVFQALLTSSIRHAVKTETLQSHMHYWLGNAIQYSRARNEDATVILDRADLNVLGVAVYHRANERLSGIRLPLPEVSDELSTVKPGMFSRLFRAVVAAKKRFLGERINSPLSPPEVPANDPDILAQLLYCIKTAKAPYGSDGAAWAAFAESNDAPVDSSSGKEFLLAQALVACGSIAIAATPNPVPLFESRLRPHSLFCELPVKNSLHELQLI